MRMRLFQRSLILAGAVLSVAFFTDPVQPGLTGHVFCANTGSAGKTFPLYGRYRDPISGVFATATVIIHVHQ